jgi:hypothetical protein
MPSGRPLLVRSAMALHRVETLRGGSRRVSDQPQPICGKPQPRCLVDRRSDLRRHEAAFLCLGAILVGFGHGVVLPYLATTRRAEDGSLAGEGTFGEPAGKKCRPGRSELLAQRVRVSLVSVSARMGRALPCCTSAASADAAAAPMTKTNSRRLLRSSRRRLPQERGARGRAVSRGPFPYLLSSCEDQSRRSVRALDGALGAD